LPVACSLVPCHRVIEEDLVDDEGKGVLAADLREGFGLPGLGEVAGGVVGVHEDEGARFGREGAAETFGIDLPAVVIDERRGLEAHVIEVGEEVEERVGGLGNEDFVAGVEEQAEEKTVGLAGAGGEDDLLGIDLRAVAGVVGADGFACGEAAAGLGIVVEGAGIREGVEKIGWVREAAAGGVGGGEVGERQAGGETLPVGAGERGLFGVPVRAVGEAHFFLRPCGPCRCEVRGRRAHHAQ
jgi:hypothetical protein